MATVPERLLDAVQETTRQYLIDSYYMSKEFGDDPKLTKSLKRVIRYLSDPGEWAEFQREVADAGNTP